jgi:hypothetical protein
MKRWSTGNGKNNRAVHIALRVLVTLTEPPHAVFLEVVANGGYQLIKTSSVSFSTSSSALRAAVTNRSVR